MKGSKEEPLSTLEEDVDAVSPLDELKALLMKHGYVFDGVVSHKDKGKGGYGITIRIDDRGNGRDEIMAMVLFSRGS